MTPELTEEEKWEFKKLRIKEPNNPWVDIIEQGYALAKKIIVNHKNAILIGRPLISCVNQKPETNDSK